MSKPIEEIIEELKESPESSIIEYKRGEYIYKENEPCSHICYIEDGGVMTSGGEGKYRGIFHVLGKNEIFGLEPIENYPKRRYDIEAFLDSKIGYIPPEIFSAELDDELFKEVTRIRGEREAELMEKFMNSNYKDNFESLTIELGKLDDKFGSKESKETEINIRGRELANLIGCSKKEIFRNMKKLKERGVVERIKTGKIKINRERLEKVLKEI